MIESCESKIKNLKNEEGTLCNEIKERQRITIALHTKEMPELLSKIV